MSATQRQAWFNLAVVSGTLVLVLALVPLMGPGAQGGFGLLGLLGLGPLFLRSRAGEVVFDERDAVIRRRAGIIAYSVFWVAFVASCVLLPVFYGWDGAVPVVVVQGAVWCGLILLVGVASVATLILSEIGGADAA